MAIFWPPGTSYPHRLWTSLRTVVWRDAAEPGAAWPCAKWLENHQQFRLTRPTIPASPTRWNPDGSAAKNTTIHTGCGQACGHRCGNMPVRLATQALQGGWRKIDRKNRLTRAAISASAHAVSTLPVDKHLDSAVRIALHALRTKAPGVIDQKTARRCITRRRATSASKVRNSRAGSLARQRHSTPSTHPPSRRHRARAATSLRAVRR